MRYGMLYSRAELWKCALLLCCQVPDENFPVLLLYIEGLRGTAKDTTVEKAEALVKSLGSGPLDKEQEKTMCRAREVIQMLS